MTDGSSGELGPGTRSRSRTRTSGQATTERVITHIDTRAMLKFSLMFVTGTLHNVEDFLAQLLAESSFTLDGTKVLLGSAGAAVVLLVTGAIFAAITSVLFNLAAGLVGGLRVTVIDSDGSAGSVAD